ncbi:MAG: glycosyltransferase family 4 protein [Gemmatimonadales bacterium]
MSELKIRADSIRPYRVAVVAACPFPCPRGTPIRIYRTAEALARRGHDVHVVTYHLGDPCEAPPFTIHRIADVPTYRKYSPGPSWQKLGIVDPLVVGRLRDLMRASGFDVIYAHHVEGLLLALAARGRMQVPIVFDAHTLLESELPFYPMGLGHSLKAGVGRVLDTVLPRFATGVIAVSEEIRRAFEAHSPELVGRISVIPNGVEVDAFDLGPGSAASGRNTLIYTGNLAAYQGIDLMLRAFAALRSKRQDVRLEIVAESGFAQYEPLALELGVRDSIDLIPLSFTEVPQRLAAATVALNPRTQCGGVPQKLLNYMAAGRPIVSFAGSAKHLRHGEDGWVVANDDVGGFADAINHLLEDRPMARIMGEKARQYVRAERSWESVGQRIEQVFRDVHGD